MTATVGGVESAGTNEAYTDCVIVSWLVRAPKVFGYVPKVQSFHFTFWVDVVM